MMNHAKRSRKISGRTKLMLVALLGSLLLALPLLPSGRAQVASVVAGKEGTAASSLLSWLPGFAMFGSTQTSPRQSPRPISAPAVGFAETRPLTEIAERAPTGRLTSAGAESEEREAAENPAIKQPTAKARAAASLLEGVVRDKALQTEAPVLNMPLPVTSFEGLGRTENIAAGFGNLSPPDTNGYVGPNHYVQQDNLLVRVWDKAGTPLTAPFRLSALFAALGGQCAAPDAGDPIVLYDQLADRWLLSQFAFTGTGTTPPYHQCIAVSKTPDPTGAYYVYDFITPGNEFPDYPKLGVWPDGYYMMVHQFTNGGPFNGSGVYSFDRVKMLAGNPAASFIYFNLNLATHPEAVGGFLPSDLDGVRPPPVGRPNTFAYFTALDFGDPADGLRLFDFHSDFATPANSTFTERPEATYASPLAVAAFSLVTPNGGAIPQPAPATSSTGLDALTDRLMYRMQYRNQGGYETLVMNHTVGAPASTVFGNFRAAPRYYELRSVAGGPFAVQEQATFAPGGSPGDGISRWMGSAAEDNQGNLAIGYSVSSGAPGNVFPGIRYAGRLATDPPGGLAQGEATLIDGTGRQTSTTFRWGDYSALTVDPVDDCTFWYTQEYYTAAGQAASAVGWQTRIGNFKFAQCTAPAKGTAHFTVTNCASNALIENAIVTLDGIPYGTTLANGIFDGSLTPGAHSYSVTKLGHSVATGNFNIVNGQTANINICLDSGSVHFTVTDCGTNAPLAGAAVAIDGTPRGTTAGDGTFDGDATPGNHTYSITKLHYLDGTGNFSITNGQITNVPVCLVGVPDVTVTKTADSSYVTAGSQVGFNVTLNNSGVVTATGLVLTDSLPAATGINWSLDGANSDAGWSVSGSPPSQNLVYTPTTLAAGATTHAHVISATSGACAGSLVLNNTATVTTGNDGQGEASATTTVLCPPGTAGPVTVTASAATPGPTDYPTVKAAFDAINAGTHKGTIIVWILGNTTETAAAVLNASGGASSYASIVMLPSGGARTVSGAIAAGSALIDLSGADNVTIDGINAGGTSLTLSNTTVSTTSGTSTVRFIGGATNNKVTNCTILGSSTATVGTAGGNVLLSTSTVAGGNSTNTISRNNIGPAGANMPTKGVMGLGTAANPNVNNLIDANNIFDFFLATTNVSGVQIGNNNNNWTISNNRIYQTAPRTFSTAASRYAGIAVASAGNSFNITGNTIGFGAANGTGTTTISGTSNEFRGIVITDSGLCSVQGNTVSGINQTSSRASTTTDLPAFIGIQTGSNATDGPANIGNLAGNIIGSLDGSSTIVINETSNTANTTPCQGILDFNFTDGNIIANNKVGSITINSGGSGTTAGFRGILVVATPGLTHTVSNNTIGGSAAGSITNNIVGSYAMYGIQVSAANAVVTGNLVRNLVGNSNGASLIVGSGIFLSGSSGANTVSQNVVHSLSNASGAGSNSIYGISCSFPAAANVVERNFVHSLNMTSSVTTGQLAGIISTAAASTATYKNNMVRLGLDASGNPVTLGLLLVGIWDGAGTNNLSFNSAYIGGSGVVSASSTFACFSQVVNNTRNYRDNICWNARSNASGNGKNYAISVAGTAPAPAGLTANFNDLFATGTGSFVGLFNGVDQTALADWRTATAQDANSISADPKFVAPVAGAATVNLHILPGSPVQLAATPIAGVTNDFDNDLRPVLKGDIGADQLTAPTAAPARISGTVRTAAGIPVAGVTMNLSGARTAKVITDSLGNYSFGSVDIDEFYTVTPSLMNFHFGPESSSFSLLGNKTDAVFTATLDDVIVGNAIDSPDYLVRQHYLDFLGREPDEGGFNFWSDQILACGSDSACRERRTINVSAAYFLSIEFQETGGLVDGLYRASFDRRPTFAEFMPDTAAVAQNVTVGVDDWVQTLAGNKEAFLAAWVQRPQFRDAYDRLTNSGYIDTLLAHADGFNGDRQALVSALNNGALTRVAALRQIVENEGVVSAKRNQTFVMMQYFGYLRRDPDDAGYEFWLHKLDEFGGNFERAEMVKAFLVSGEYRNRFQR